MVNTLADKELALRDKSMLFTHFYLSEKKTETWTVSPISRYTAKYVFS